MKKLSQLFTLALCSLLTAATVNAAPTPVATADVAEQPTETAVQTDASLMGAAIKPGRNQLTGQYAVWSFDEATSSATWKGRLTSHDSNAYAGTVTFPDVSEELKDVTLKNLSGKALKYEHTNVGPEKKYSYIYWETNLTSNLPVGESKYVLIADVYSTTGMSGNITINKTSTTIKVPAGESKLIKEFKFDSSVTSAQGFVTYHPSTIAAFDLYFDNIAVFPMYKVTYYGVDGSVAKTDWALLDSDGNLLTEYTIDANAVSGATGYYVNVETKEPVTKVALQNADINIYAFVEENITLVNGDSTQKVDVSNVEKYTFGNTLNGEEIKDFIFWIDADGNRYRVGDVIDKASAVGKVYTAYAQDATIPAMGMYYEGTEENNYNVKKASTVHLTNGGNVIDEGKNVHKIYGTANTANEAGRLVINAANGYDTREYRIIETSFKVAPKTSTGTVSETGINMFRLYYMPVPGLHLINFSKESYKPATWTEVSGYSIYSPFVFQPLKGKPISYTYNEYSKVVIDADDIGFYTYNGIQVPYGYMDNVNMGFTLEPFRKAEEVNIYLDYLRVYRKGALTVTYDSNAPAGVTVTGTVAADTNRGAGKGYLLNTEHPTAEGYVFCGWATSKDAGTNQVVKTIDLKDDTTVYAVWEKENVPLSYGENSIRVDSYQGIRFKASVNNAVKADAKTTEYGFIVTRESLLEGRAHDYLTFEHTDVIYVSGVNYNAQTGVDKIYEVDNDNVFITAVIYGITESKEAYEDRLVVRPYIKYDGETLYGSPMARSVLSVAEALRDGGYKNLDENGKNFVQKVLTTCGKEL